MTWTMRRRSGEPLCARWPQSISPVYPRACGKVLSVMTTRVISRISSRFSSLGRKDGTHEFGQVYRGSGSWPSLISPPHLAQVSGCRKEGPAP